MPPQAFPDLCIGWHVKEPDDRAPSVLFDDPPLAPPDQLVAAHQAWRAKVEDDERRLDVLHQQQPIWFPVETGSTVRVLPIFGGTPETIEQVAATVVGSALSAGIDQVRVTNLTGMPVLGRLRKACANLRGWSAVFGEASGTGSTIDLFEHRSFDELASALVDSLRIDPAGLGRQNATAQEQAIIGVGRLLDPTITIDKLCTAIDVALGNASAAQGVLSDPERRRLRDYAANTVDKRDTLKRVLEDLHLQLQALDAYSRRAGHRPQTYGTGPARLLVSEASAGSTGHHAETARELLARAIARKFSQPTKRREMLVVLGADEIAPDVLKALKNAAQQHDKQLVLLFTTITPEAEATMGHAGSGACVFLRLPNHQSARIASEFLGREYTFVVNGISIAEGSTTEWSNSNTTGSSSSTARGRTSGSNSGSAGGTLSFGRSFGTSVTNTLSTSQSTTSTTGGGTSTTNTMNQGRVHEYVVEPEVFQKMADSMMLIVDGDRVMLANADPSIRRLPVTSPTPLAIP